MRIHSLTEYFRNCAGLNGKLIPCSCPPDRGAFIAVRILSTYLTKSTPTDLPLIMPSTGTERERRGRPHSEQPRHRRAVPDWRVQGGQAGAHRDAALYAPEPPRARRRLPRGRDCVRPDPAESERAPVREPLSCLCAGPGEAWGWEHGEGERVDLTGRCRPGLAFVFGYVDSILQSRGASRPIPAVHPLCLCVFSAFPQRLAV